MTMLKHIAISLDDISSWCSRNNIEISKGFELYFRNLGKLFSIQPKSGIQIITIYMLPENADKPNDYMTFSDCIADFFSQMSANPMLHNNKIKISVFGKWYNLPSKAIESIKNIIESTKDYDSLFANFCINYDGQEEIADACRLIAKQVELGKITPEMITKNSIKENIYSSYFMPPDVFLIYGERKLSGLLLWDSPNANVIFADKSFMEFEEGDVDQLNLNRNLFK